MELGRPKIKYLYEILLLKRAVPEELQSFYLEKARKLSPPNRMLILPEWDNWLFPVHALHQFGISIENAEELFNLSSIAYRCSLNMFHLSVTSVARTVDPSPVNGSRLTRERLPCVYMLGGRLCKADLEIRLFWEPKSYGMPIEDEPVSMDLTRGMDLLFPNLETGKEGTSLLCLQAAWCKGCPLCKQPLEHTLYKPSL